MEQQWKTSYHKDMTWKRANTIDTILKKQKDAEIKLRKVGVRAHNNIWYLDITMPVPDIVMWCLHSNTIQNLIGQLQGINCRSALVQSTIFVEPLATSGLRSNYAAFFPHMFDIVFCREL